MHKKPLFIVLVVLAALIGSAFALTSVNKQAVQEAGCQIQNLSAESCCAECTCECDCQDCDCTCCCKCDCSCCKDKCECSDCNCCEGKKGGCDKGKGSCGKTGGCKK